MAARPSASLRDSTWGNWERPSGRHSTGKRSRKSAVPGRPERPGGDGGPVRPHDHSAISRVVTSSMSSGRPAGPRPDRRGVRRRGSAVGPPGRQPRRGEGGEQAPSSGLACPRRRGSTPHREGRSPASCERSRDRAHRCDGEMVEPSLAHPAHDPSGSPHVRVGPTSNRGLVHSSSMQPRVYTAFGFRISGDRRRS